MTKSLRSGRAALAALSFLGALTIPLITSVAPAAAAGGYVDRVNFQRDTGPVPAGYVRDYGQPYDATRGYGWVRVDTSDPLSLVGNGRNRNVNLDDERLDTHVNMQYQGTNGVTTPGRWEHALPNGTYEVTVAVGDPSYTDSVHRLTADGGVVLVDNFVPTTSNLYLTATKRVTVTDGRLTLDPTGGTQTKLCYIDIVDVTPRVAAVVPTDSASGVSETANIQITANQAIDPASVSSSSVSVTGPGGPVAGAYATDGPSGTITFDPTAPLASLATYQVAVTSALRTPTADPFQPFASSFSTGVSASGSIQITSPEDRLRTGLRLVFSTVANEARPGKSLTVRNNGPGPLNVNGLAISGPDAADFQLAAGQPSSFVVPAGETRPVAIEFRPTAQGVENFATLTVSSSDQATPTTQVALRGLNADGYEGSLEPSVAAIVDLLGYTTNVGWSGYKSCQQTGSVERADCELPKGDEIISPYWQRVDTNAPVGMVPLAKFSNRVDFEQGATGWANFAPPSQTAVPTRHFVMTYPGGSDISGGQNQRLFPEVRGDTSFTPSGVFGLYSYYSDFSDERFNKYNLHNFRFYPARDPSGALIPNAYLVLFDPTGDSAKNWDYNDLMWLMTNVAPTFPTNGASTPLERTFSTATAGTLADRNGLGTGFKTVVGPATGHVPADLLLSPSAGTLSITARPGTTDGTANNQANMLANVIDATEADNQRVSVRLNGPLCLPSDGRTEAGVFFGPDQDHTYKLVIANAGAATEVQVIKEELGVRSVLATAPVSDCATVRYVDLTLRLFAGTARIGYQYVVYRTDGTNSGTVVGSNIFDVVHQQLWFNQASLSGVVVSSTASTPWTAVFDRWKFYLP